MIEADQLIAFRHEGFWRPMDTLKDKEVLEDMVEKGTMPWRHGTLQFPRPQLAEGGMTPRFAAPKR